MFKAKLIFDCPEKNADLYYATHFLAPDDVLYLEHRGKKYFILSDLEYERGRREANVDAVFSLAEWTLKARKKGQTGSVGVIATLLKHFRIKEVIVPRSTPFTVVDGLRKIGIRVIEGTFPFYPERSVKTAQEKKWMFKSQKTAFQAFAHVEKILREAVIKKNLLFWRGKILTSEGVHFEIDQFLLEKGFRNVSECIVAGGLQACDPHCRGSGPLKPHQAIIVDIFPRSEKTRFYGDATRTFCKGKASPALKKQYEAVKKAQNLAIQKIKAGANGKTIYQTVTKYFEQNGFPTKEINGYKQGFIHGLGHGIGLEIHEYPARLTSTDFKLKVGHAVTVEPGLYYRKTGGVRLEDIVYVTKTGCEVLGTYPKRLEIP